MTLFDPGLREGASPPPLDLSGDFITDYMTMTESDITPRLFRLWSAISTVGGALESRVWAQSGYRGGKPQLTYANTYIFLVGPSGSGKGTIEDIQAILSDVTDPATGSGALHVAPTNMTKAAMIDTLGEAEQVFYPPEGGILRYHSLLVAAEEFSVFMPDFDNEFINNLNVLYNLRPFHIERRRHGKPPTVSIGSPLLNLLSGIQPKRMGTQFPDEVWDTGFGSRMMMIYSPEKPKTEEPFAQSMVDLRIRPELLSRLFHMTRLYGELKIGPVAYERVKRFHNASETFQPTHSKLVAYCNRRVQHLTKLCIISAISRGSDTEIQLVDVERAIAWLQEAESLMPDVFRAMLGNSDDSIIEETYNYVFKTWNSRKQKPLTENEIWSFVARRVPAEKIKKIIEACELTNRIERVAGQNMYLPKGRTDFTVE